MIIPASLLRDKTYIKAVVPSNKPGYYKWWAENDDVDFLLLKLGADASLKSYIEKNDFNQYCIYVGIAAKESIAGRLDWHVNDKHTESRVKNGTLSTLRKSIASVVANNQYDKSATNIFMDRLYVEYFAIDDDIKSSKAISLLHLVEKKIMQEHLCILNIQENKHPKSFTIIKELKRLRKMSK